MAIRATSSLLALVVDNDLISGLKALDHNYNNYIVCCLDLVHLLQEPQMSHSVCHYKINDLTVWVGVGNFIERSQFCMPISVCYIQN